MTGNCTGGRIYYRHCNYDREHTCEFHSIKKEELADPVLEYLYSFFTDEPTFMDAVTRALPKADDRARLEEEHEQVKASLARAERQVARLVDAITQGADPALLVSKQTELKNECARYREQLRVIETRLATIPDATLVKHQATAIRLQLLQKVRDRDWRKLSFDEIRRFLIFLFGENPGKTGNGITVRLEKGRWRISFKGAVEFQHELSDGRPLSRAFLTEAAHYNKRAAAQFVALTRQT